jgi:16S rRNA (guanine966-N2)-methyltransferase
VRVIAGSAKGTRLAPVPAGTRPVSDRAREGLFSSLGGRVEGSRVLDLFAGTGALGLEALSRGAEGALFVDSGPAATRTIRTNLAHARLEGRGRVRRQDVRRTLRSKPGQFDLILVDPPYEIPPEELDEAIRLLADEGVAAPGARVVLTRSVRSYTPVIPLDWLLERRLSYGDTVVLVFAVP